MSDISDLLTVIIFLFNIIVIGLRSCVRREALYNILTEFGITKKIGKANKNVSD
jgi:hypothetical protein